MFGEEELRAQEARASRSRQSAPPRPPQSRGTGAPRRGTGGWGTFGGARESDPGRTAVRKSFPSSVPLGQRRPKPPLGVGRRASAATGSSVRARARVHSPPPSRRRYVRAAGARPGRAYKGGPVPGALAPRCPRASRGPACEPLQAFRLPRRLPRSCPSFIYFGGGRRGHLS